MQGRILDFSSTEGRGIITGDDGNRYTFLGQAWKEQQAPAKGQVVDYVVDDDGSAVDVYLVLSPPSAIGAIGEIFKKLTTNPGSKDKSELGSKNKSEFSAIDWYLTSFKKYATFSGRASRKEYWFFVLFHYLVLFGLLSIGPVLFGIDGANLLSTLFALASIVPGVAVGARRLHDIGKTGWLQLLYIIPFVGFIIMIILFAKEGDAADNAYGPNPLA